MRCGLLASRLELLAMIRSGPGLLEYRCGSLENHLGVPLRLPGSGLLFALAGPAFLPLATLSKKETEDQLKQS